ncbi:MAG: uroporphyrinogen-III C-methyltransferase [Nitrosomonas sp.]|nr:uroporphyrinogen-III C-methyltransferase [Nitrosomonas sp.]MDP1951469.1 uroporphyrinogen-III C-methyltransferase [Nitrosomonas sp.]
MNRETRISKPRHRLSLLLLVAIFIIFTVWQWPSISSKISNSRQALTAYIAEIDVLGENLRALMAEVSATKSAAEDRLNQFEAQLIESQNLQVAINAQRQAFSDDPNVGVLEEIEQLITFADQHLNLTGNVKAALDNLRTAETLLQQMDNPQLLSLHAGLIKDIENLEGAPDTHTMRMEISARLNNLKATVDALPLLMDTDLTTIEIDLIPRQRPDESKLWLKFLNEIWADLKTFIHAQRVSNPEIQLLSPSQANFLKENLKLKFILMRFSLLSHDKDSFDTDLKATINWINKYYDQNSEPVITMLQALGQLQDDKVGFELPNVSASLEALHNFRNMRNEENK